MMHLIFKCNQFGMTQNGHRVHRFILCLNYMMFPLVLSPRPLFEAVYCFICGRRRMTVAQYRMIYLVLHTYVIDDERWNLMKFGSQGIRSRSTLAHNPLKPRGHAIEYNLYQSKFETSNLKLVRTPLNVLLRGF